MSSTFLGASASPAEELRRSFAVAWGAIGAAWGVAPSTATVQGYLLVSEGPLTEPEVRRALGMSHRAASMALAQCEEWGLIERAEGPRRSGQRGPAAVADCGGRSIVSQFFAALGAVDLADALVATAVAVVMGLVWLAGYFVRHRQGGPAASAQASDRVHRERRGF